MIEAKTVRGVRFWFGVSFCVSFVVGICCILLGCNTNLKGQCIRYNVVYGTSYDYFVDAHTCKTCTGYDKNGNCKSYNYYTCYDSYVKFHYDGNSTCNLQVDSDDISSYSAQETAENYGIGKSTHLLKEKHSNECINTTDGLNIWISGVSFLSFCALIIILYIIFEFYIQPHTEKFPPEITIQ